MQTLQIATVPNQTFSTTLNNNRYDFAIYQCNGIMCCDITLNENAIVSGARLTNGSFLIPFFYLEDGDGNFLLLTANGELPNYEKFGSSQTLIYLTNAEIEAAVLAAGTIQPIFVAYEVA